MSGNISFEKLLRHTLGDEQPPMKPGKRGPILAVSKQDQGLQDLLNHDSERVRDLMRARLAVRSWPTHTKRLDTMTKQAEACGGKLPVQLKYGGAHTLRWSGDGGWNAQNFGARAHPLISEVRGLIRAPHAHRLIICDFAAIEARVLAWLSGQNDLIELFANGGDAYVDMASKITGRSIWKPRDHDPPPVRKYLKRFRQMGKVAVLGCGYGMGPDRCRDYAAQPPNNLDLTYDEAHNIVTTYRESVPQITQFWRDIEAAAIHTTEYTYPSDCRCLRLTYDPRKDVMYIRLPSGRRLRYHRPRVDRDDGYPTFYCVVPARGRVDMWGGFLTENIVQAISRDLLAEAILSTERAGYRVAMHVHDEIVAVVPFMAAEQAKKQIEDIMSTAPAWADGLPLAAEAQITERYTK